MYCKYCGNPMNDAEKICSRCGKPVGDDTHVDYDFSNNSNGNYYSSNGYQGELKNRYVAGILGILLGGIGVHKAYCGQMGMFILYLLFCWTGIPGIVGLIEGIIYLTCPSDEEFTRRYCK